jgi:hypothetical protein
MSRSCLHAWWYLHVLFDRTPRTVFHLSTLGPLRLNTGLRLEDTRPICFVYHTAWHRISSWIEGSIPARIDDSGIYGNLS